MLRTFIARLLVAVACLVCLAGCGEGDSETRGEIIVGVNSTELTAGLYLIEVVASYANPDLSGGASGFPITITARIETPSGALIGERSVELRTDSNGEVNYDLEVEQGSLPSIVTITASSGGLADSERVTIPALAPITSAPATLAFPATSAAGATVSATISGGVGPYTATVDAAHAADLTATISGNNLIVTRRNPSNATGPVNLATVTVSGANSAPLSIGVTYQ